MTAFDEFDRATEGAGHALETLRGLLSAIESGAVTWDRIPVVTEWTRDELRSLSGAVLEQREALKSHADELGEGRLEALDSLAQEMEEVVTRLCELLEVRG